MTTGRAPTTRARRDPEGRRRALVASTVEVIRDVGVTRVTHRMVAAKAGVPLGSTTYYFATLDDLLVAAIESIVADVRAYLRVWGELLSESTDVPGTLVEIAQAYVADRSRAQFEYEVYVAAARTPVLQELAKVWKDEVPATLGVRVGTEAARAISLVLNGAMIEAVVTRTELDAEHLRAVFHSVL